MKKTLETDIKIDASPQTVWSVMDDLDRYPAWNELVPEFAGRTTVGEVLSGTIVLNEIPPFPLTPTLLRVVGARELRWITRRPDEIVTSGEHYFILKPTADGGTHLFHNETFESEAMEMIWPAIQASTLSAYLRMNEALKARAEALEQAIPTLHPAVDDGIAASAGSSGLTLRCHCLTDPVEVVLDEPVVHNHLCGCSKCWKPAGARFAQTAVVPVGTLHVTENEEKLTVIDPAQAIKRHACRKCGVHMFGHVDDVDHHFYGIDFVHPELAIEPAAPPPEFAGFVSSLIETGENPSNMRAIRRRLERLGIPSYDVFSPELMDIIAWHKVKMKRYAKQ
jgi:S-(hydroxymethyl)glutathione synthase